jgi:hypothetical protein
MNDIRWNVFSGFVTLVGDGGRVEAWGGKLIRYEWLLSVREQT